MIIIRDVTIHTQKSFQPKICTRSAQKHLIEFSFSQITKFNPLHIFVYEPKAIEHGHAFE
jgi:hypothetical protein